MARLVSKKVAIAYCNFYLSIKDISGVSPGGDLAMYGENMHLIKKKKFSQLWIDFVPEELKRDKERRNIIG